MNHTMQAIQSPLKTEKTPDEKAPTALEVGQALRMAREQRHLTIEDVARKTRIRDIYLLALEAGSVEKLPGLTFAFGFLRLYAESLELTEERLLVEAYIAASGSHKAPLKPEIFPAPTTSKHKPSTSLVVFGVVCFVGIFWIYENYFASNIVIPEIPQTAPLRVGEEGRLDQTTTLGGDMSEGSETESGLVERFFAPPSPEEEQADTMDSTISSASNVPKKQVLIIHPPQVKIPPVSVQAYKKPSFDQKRSNLMQTVKASKPVKPDHDRVSNTLSAVLPPSKVVKVEETYEKIKAENTHKKISKNEKIDVEKIDEKIKVKVKEIPKESGYPFSTIDKERVVARVDSSLPSRWEESETETEIEEIPKERVKIKKRVTQTQSDPMQLIRDRYPEKVTQEKDLKPESPKAISLMATELVWVQIQDKEGVVLKDMVMQPDEQFRVPYGGEFFAILGNAGAVQIRVGRKLLPLLGRSGEMIEHLDLNSETLLDRRLATP